jgi:hypothetical protein
LNNILLIHETITWAKKSKQPLLFFRLNFSKAYDKVNWRFLFDCMDKLQVPIKFVKTTKVLFQGVNASIVVNGKAFKALVFEKDVW